MRRLRSNVRAVAASFSRRFGRPAGNAPSHCHDSGGTACFKATVFLTDSQGVTRTARTGSPGYFQFDDVQAGETYVVVINHKRYTFTPRVVTVEDEITELDFVAIE